MGFFLETLHEELLYLVSRHESRTAKGPRKDTATTPNKMSDDVSEEREVTRPVSPSAGRDDGWLEVGKNQKLNVVRTVSRLALLVEALQSG
jgi:ubiquitin carboxyl-terminal hydrolase 10